MKIRFKSEQDMNEYGYGTDVPSNNRQLVEEYGMGIITINRIYDIWWDVIEPGHELASFTICIEDESKYFEIVEE